MNNPDHAEYLRGGRVGGMQKYRIIEVMNLVFLSAQSTKSEFTVDPGE